MEEDNAKPNISHLEWGIIQRANIQHTLLALYETACKSSLKGGWPPIAANGIFVEPYLFDHFIAAAFSLWRAVFLAETDRSWTTTREHQKKFLKKLVTSNAIGFNDDFNSRAWTVRFYLEAAKQRLLVANGVIGHYLPERNLPSVVLLLHVSGTTSPQTRYEWEAVHRALRILMKAFDPQMNLPIDELSLPEE